MTIYVAHLDLQQVAFADKAHAEAVAKQWDQDHAHAVEEHRADGLGRLADRLIARIEEQPDEQWARLGPGGMSAVWRQMPDRRLVHYRTAQYGSGGRKVTDTGLCVGWRWEFQEDGYTAQAAQCRVERRPGAAVLVEATARGLDQQAVEGAFKQAANRALAMLTEE